MTYFENPPKSPQKVTSFQLRESVKSVTSAQG